MKKIIIEREEGIAEVIDRILGEGDEELTLVIPKGSVLGKTVSNFHLLKREADQAGKSISVESVDDGILAFAKESEINGSHPLWRGAHGGGMADIVPAEGGSEEEAGEPARPRRKATQKKKPVKLTVHTETTETEDEELEIGTEIAPEIREEDEEIEEKEDRFLGVGRFFRPRRREEVAEEGGENGGDDDEDEFDGAGSRTAGKFIWFGVAAAILVVAAFAVATWGFGHASVAIEFKKTPWSYQGTFAADKAASVANASAGVLPAQVFSTKKNLTQTFSASGNANVAIKARGTITVYNAFNGKPQELVATTRFVTPDGKIFRLVNNITVPGAQTAGGRLVSSSIDASVVADQPGPGYNVGPVTRLSIPGFRNSARYSGFYGELKQGTSGGAVGKRPVPTAKDVAGAKAQVTAALQSSLASDIATSYPNNFKIPEGATSAQITKLTVSTTTDANGNFSVFGEATLQAIGFDEAGFDGLLLALAQTTEPSSTFNSLTVNYGSIQPDFIRGRVSFMVTAQGTLKPAFSADDFRTNIAGMSIGQARMAIAGIPQLANGQISVWPAWLWNIPSNPAKVAVTAN